MKTAILGIVLLFTLTVAGQQVAKAPSVKLFHGDKSCYCIPTKKKTATVIATEERKGNQIDQVFCTRSEPRRELFRVTIGSIEKEGPVKWWNYGIVEEGDFNGDGVPDYSWYGGDDSGDEEYVFLSSSDGYKRLAIHATIEAAWTNRFHKKPPDLGTYGGDYGYTKPVLERSDKGLVLVIRLSKLNDAEDPIASYDFRIPEVEFLP